MTDKDLNTVMDGVEESASRSAFEFKLFPYTDRRVRKFGIHRRVFTTRLIQSDGASLPSGSVLPQLIESALQRAVNEQLLDGNESEDDILFINMSSNRLRTSYQSHKIKVSDWKRDTEPARQLLEMLSKILNSNEQFEINDSFHIEITHIKDPLPGSGGKRLKPGEKHIDDLLRTKRSVVYIDNKDELCCARALVVTKAKKDRHPNYDTIRRGKGALQGKMARELHQEACVPEGPCGQEEIALFQNMLLEYQIVVVSADQDNKIIYKGPSQPEDKQLILIKVGAHYHACHSIKAFFGKSYFCVDCEKGFNEDEMSHHKCNKCYSCHQYECSDFKKSTGKASVECQSCHRWFFGPVCMQNHRLYKSQSGVLADSTKQNSVCDTYKRCSNCSKLLRRREILEHKCGFAKCPSCTQYLNLDEHRCFLQQVVEEDEKKGKRDCESTAGSATLRSNKENVEDEEEKEELLQPIFVYYDIEARQDGDRHVANLLCAEREDEDDPVVFEGENCVEAFIEWARSLSTTNDHNTTQEIICVAHNFQGYDSYFVLNEFYRQFICPQQIVNGAKILCMKVKGLKFIDSMAFLPMPLSGFGKAFGLQELKKGFFPHFFNTLNNQDYVGSIPSKDYYDPQGMSPERKNDFENWYCAREASKFDFKEEIKAYCKSDVRLLKEGCKQFQKDFQQLAQFNPMEKCITIASACNRYYRKMCLKPNTIASEPVRGWHGKSKPHSHAALEWLHWVEHGLREQKISRGAVADRLLHAGNSGEHKISIAGQNVMRVDGYDVSTKKVYEFHGCFYHGCPICFPNRDKRHPKHNDMSMREIYQKTQKRDKSIRQAGYQLDIMWECEWNQLKKSQSEIKEFLDTLQLKSRLEPRDAFYGGRTNAIQLHRKTNPGEEIRYVDYTSLYPWVNKNCEYPVGHPTILTQTEGTDISHYFGLVKCTVVPPHCLYYPVLPYRCGGKLTFPLCGTCVKTQLPLPLLQRTHYCPHDENERSLTGTWCTPELQEAVSQGYVIQKIYEVWHFEDQSTDLFKEYVNTFLKIKQEASDWPSDVGNNRLKRKQYLHNYKDHEGIQLDETKIEKNAGKRSLAKLMLNSFWGKFGQASNKSKVESITSPARFYELLRDDSCNIHSVRVVNDEMIEAVYTYQPESDPVQINTNIFIACFTTCWARLKLYDGIKHLRHDQVLYFDTDSVIYVWRKGLPELSLGNYLGEFTNELDDGDYITEFASAGPKNYGYRTQKGKVKCKVRGFSLNVRGQEQLNFDILRDNVLAELQQPRVKLRNIPVTNPHKITRDPKTKTITTRTEIKRYSLVFDKRVVDPDTFVSYPYGFQREAKVRLY